MSASAGRVEAPGAVTRPGTRTHAARPMATPMPHAWERVLALALSVAFWGACVLYVVVFTAVSLRQYDTYVPHALDLGNMAQAFWNTVHGRPFRFQNMRAHVGIEAFGTMTRLSFHVEPIIPFLAIFYYFYQHVQTLLVMQTVAVATGAIPARLLARRRLGHPLAEIAFPLAYLLFPALEAANLYEFHPVTFAAPLLLWAFYFADERRYTLFVVTAVAAMGCKEELGVLVAVIGLWIAVRNGERHFGAIVAVLGLAWSYIALREIVPHFHGAASSYWGRYLPKNVAPPGTLVSQSMVIHYWLHHPLDVLRDLTSEAKLSYLHRILYPTGYLALFSPLTLLAGLPTLALNLLSFEPHMYGGLAHYNAELVPVMVVSSILGVEWLARVVAPCVRIPARWAIAALSLYVLFAALANQRVNGLSPLAASFDYPAITAHDRLLDTAIGMIPPDASVSAQDNINAHLSDRPYIFLFNDTDFGRVQYIILDATLPTSSLIPPCELAVLVTGDGTACNLVAGPVSASFHPGIIDKTALLPSGKWNILFAQDGILLLKKRLPAEALHNTLPPSFFTFAIPSPGNAPSGPPIAGIGPAGNPYLELLGYRVDRRELTNLHNPDVVLTTWWRALRPLPARSRLMHYLTDSSGAIQVARSDQQATDWLPLSQWHTGTTYKVESVQLTVTTQHSGWIDADVGLAINDATFQNPADDQPVRLLHPTGVVAGVGGGSILKVAHIAAHL